MLSVKDFGALGNDQADDTSAIRAALKAAALTETVYFPAGTYLVTAGIDISGKKIVGEPSLPTLDAGTGTIIRVAQTAQPFDGGVLFSSAITTPGPPCAKKGGKRVHLTSIEIDVNQRASYALHLHGSSHAVVWQVLARNALLDNFLLDGCQLAHFWLLMSRCAGRHGIHMIDCNGATLQNFGSNYSGRARAPCAIGQPNHESCGLLITNECHSGGVYVEHGDIEGGAGPAIYIKNAVKVAGDGTLYFSVMPTIVEKVWIENKSITDTVVLDGVHSVILQNCRIQDKETDVSLDRRAIRLKNGAFSNIIRDNLIAVEGESLSGTGVSHGDQIELEAGCFNNHLENNLSLRNVPINRPSGVPVITHDRNHIIGQRQLISHRGRAPTSGTWEVGDIVFNAHPDHLKVAGWICVRETTPTAPAIWKSFGRFT